MPEKSRQQMVGIAPALINVITGVTTSKAFHRYHEIEVMIGGFFLLEFEGEFGIHATGATDEQFSFVLRIEVDEPGSIKKAFFQTESTVQPSFFVNSEQAFHGAM